MRSKAILNTKIVSFTSPCVDAASPYALPHLHKITLSFSMVVAVKRGNDQSTFGAISQFLVNNYTV